MSSLNPQAIEFMEREIVLASERHTGRSVFPQEMGGQPVGAYLLITLDSDSEDQLYTLLEQAAELVLDAGAMDVLVADSLQKCVMPGCPFCLSGSYYGRNKTS